MSQGDPHLHRFHVLLDQVYHPEHVYEILKEDAHYFMRVRFAAPDNTEVWGGGRHHAAPMTAYLQLGRKWRLSPHMTDGEVIQTALMATLACAEHEHRERFTYKGKAIFGPHFDVEKLVELCGSATATKERSHGQG